MSVVCALVTGCGSTHPSADAVAACTGAAGDRAAAEVVEAAYRAGKLGSAATVRSEVAALGPLPGAGKESFLRKDGTMVPWASMDDAQQFTFKLWSHGSKESENGVGTQALRASQLAAAQAKDRCG